VLSRRRADRVDSIPDLLVRGKPFLHPGKISVQKVDLVHDDTRLDFRGFRGNEESVKEPEVGHRLARGEYDKKVVEIGDQGVLPTL
jgi:hypothetical protein